MSELNNIKNAFQAAQLKFNHGLDGIVAQVLKEALVAARDLRPEVTVQVDATLISHVAARLTKEGFTVKEHKVFVGDSRDGYDAPALRISGWAS